MKMFEIKKFLFQFTMYGFVTLLLMSSVMVASETPDANEIPNTEKWVASRPEAIEQQAQTYADRVAEIQQEEDRKLDNEFEG